MVGFAAIGGTLLGVGTAVTFTTVAVGVVASAVVGAVVGGLVSAVSGGDIGQGMLIGAIGGMALGAAFGGAVFGAGASGSIPSATALVPENAGAASTFGSASGIAPTTTLSGESIVGSSGVLGGSISDADKLIASTASSGVKGVYDAKLAGDAATLSQEEADKQRAFLSSESDKSLANALERAEIAASSSPSFYLSEKQALSKTDTDEAIRKYEAQIATDVEARSTQAGKTATGILNVAPATRGTFVESDKIGIDRIGATV